MKKNYYTVKVPGDCADTIEKLGHIAIAEAEDRTRMYFMPAMWLAHLVSGQLGDWEVKFRVVRYHN